MNISSKEELIKYLNDNGHERFTFNTISTQLKIKHNIPVNRTVKLLRELKYAGIVKRVSYSQNCTTICASCYEYGCDAGQKAPVNYWVIEN